MHSACNTCTRAMYRSVYTSVTETSDSICKGESTVVTLHVSIVRIIMKVVGSATGTTHTRLK